ncbi:helix-turn-helix transcriptional regulator [Noviherbaspirillum sp. Root189]|uniref:helix-turn-helix transcriptional regulator n=1 Tax=Noviherbaspirillum sp. Root189 TaxID=1736487 RepID=UPI000715356C|nr:LuxR C-terminal-related transcriptional regulator [Noviherbaspirillum sp. Root189]KRB83848.1 hypothetical protein ASE07_23280 [Noviherbaspirillum sp. Root189]
MNARHDGSMPLSATLELIESVGRRGFYGAMLRTVNRFAQVDHCALMRIPVDGEIEVFGADSKSSPSLLAAATVAYIDHFHKFDPNRVLLRDAKSMRGALLVHRQRRADMGDRAYREACYERSELVERLSFSTAIEDGSLVALNVYRRDVTGEFSMAEIDALTNVAPVLLAACVRHVDLIRCVVRDAESWHELLKMRCASLTKREADVLSCMLSGMTLRDAAQACGIAYSSAVTYSSRAYNRLGVRTLREVKNLFEAG